MPEEQENFSSSDNGKTTSHVVKRPWYEPFVSLVSFPKYVALLLLITLVVFGFYAGFQYGSKSFKNIDNPQEIGVKNSEPKTQVKEATPLLVSSTGTITNIDSNIPPDWNVFRNNEYGFEIGYPSDYIATNKQASGETLPGSWRIYQNGELPYGHGPKTIWLKIIDANEIYSNDLGGTYTKYDPERGLCYTYSTPNSARVYLTEKINGYAVCKHSTGDAGSFGSSVIFIYPDKIRALKVSTGGDESQKSAPLNDFSSTVHLLGN